MSLTSVMSRDHFVYRAFDGEGRLLYVGCSINVSKRLAEHRRTKWHPLMARLDVEGPHPYHKARAIEWEAIQSESPSYNRQTPKALAHRRAVTKFIEDFIAVAMSHGETFNDALTQAVIAADIELAEDAA